VTQVCTRVIPVVNALPFAILSSALSTPSPYISSTPSVIFSPITRARPDSSRHQTARGLALSRIVLAAADSGRDWMSRGGADAQRNQNPSYFRLGKRSCDLILPLPTSNTTRHRTTAFALVTGYLLSLTWEKLPLQQAILFSCCLLRCRLPHAASYETHQGHSRIAEVLTSCMNFPQASSNSP
jgi:hypothetical protein